MLTEWLRETHPEDERKLRAALLLALNQAEPPEDSVADQELTFQRLQNEWMLAAPNSPEQARAADQIAEAIEAGGVPDATVVKYLNEPLGRFDIPLDDKWKKRLYSGGLPGLGWKKVMRQLWLVFPLLVSVGIFGWWWQPEAPWTPQECNARIWTVMEPGFGLGDSIRILICTREDSLVASEYLLQKVIDKAAALSELDFSFEKGILLGRDDYLFKSKAFNIITIHLPSLVELTGQRTVQDTVYEAFRANIGAMLWNRGLQLEGDTTALSQAACEFYQVADSLFRNAGYALGEGRAEVLERCGGDFVPRPLMQPIPAGTFQMGDTFDDDEFDREKPVHEVTLSAFELARDELTFEEYDLYCDSMKIEKPDDRGWGRGPRPVINVSWEDAVKYCNWLSEQHGYTPVYSGTEEGGEVTANWSANGYRLPTEAEWEYAAAYRPDGTKARFGNGKDTLRASEANFRATEDYKKPYSEAGEYREKTLPVGSFPGNDRRLRDMAGNVYEWCWDWYGDYGGTAARNPRGPVTGSFRVIRGGSWITGPVNCRTVFRGNGGPSFSYYYVGFRLARSSRGE